MVTADQPLDLRTLIEAVEAAPPIDAVDVLTSVLGEMVGATHVSLLLADFSGSAVRRLSHITAGHELRHGRNERVESLPLADSAYERVMFGQELEIAKDGDGWLLLLPFTERGDAIGLPELSLPNHPNNEIVAYLVSAATPSRTSSSMVAKSSRLATWTSRACGALQPRTARGPQTLQP